MGETHVIVKGNIGHGNKMAEESIKAKDGKKANSKWADAKSFIEELEKSKPSKDIN